MSGGSVTDHKIFGDSVYVNTMNSDGVDCALYLERCKASEAISLHDVISWESGPAIWSPRGSLNEDIKINRIGFSGVAYPHDRPVVKPKYI